MSVNEFYKIDLSDGTAAQLLDICRYAPAPRQSSGAPRSSTLRFPQAPMIPSQTHC